MKRPGPGNVLLVANFPSDTGYAWWLMEHFWTLLAKRFISAGGKAYVAYPEITTPPAALIGAGLHPIELTLPWKDADDRRKALSFIRRNNIRTIYFTDRPWFNPQYASLRMAGVKRIVIHDHAPGDRPPATGIKGFIKALRHRFRPFCADFIFCVSELMRERAIRAKRVPANRAITVQNGVLPIEWRPDRSGLRASLELRPDTFVVMTTGRAHPYKRFDFIIRTAALLQQESPDLDFAFVLIGDGPALDDLRTLVSQLDVDRRVKLVGFHSDPSRLLPSADIAMHAALGEGFSLSIVEYMSAGLPVLVPNIPSVCQAIDHGVNGLVYDRDDERMAARHVLALANDSTVRNRLGAAARGKATAQYCLSRCSADFELAIDVALASDHKSSQRKALSGAY